MGVNDCPHCGAGNTLIADHCGACGKELPSQRWSADKETRLGRTAQSPPLDRATLSRTRRRRCWIAAGILFLVGAYFVATGLRGAQLVSQNSNLLPAGYRHHAPAIAKTVLVAMSIFGGVYALLGLWAILRPFAPTIIALAIYLTLIVAGIAANPTMVSALSLVLNTMLIGGLIAAVVLAAQARRIRMQLREA